MEDAKAVAQQQRQQEAQVAPSAVSRFPSDVDAHLRLPGLYSRTFSLHHSQNPNPNPQTLPQQSQQQQKQTTANVPQNLLQQLQQKEIRPRSQTELQMAHQDAWRVCHPDVHRPFSSLEDAAERLLPYHVVADYEAEEEDSILDSDTTGQVLSRSQQWDRSIAAKVAEFMNTFEKQALAFNIITHKRNIGEFRSEERLMIEQARLQEEKRALLELRAEIESRDKAGQKAHAQMAAMDEMEHAHADAQARGPIRASAFEAQAEGNDVLMAHDMGEQEHGGNRDMVKRIGQSMKPSNFQLHQAKKFSLDELRWATGNFNEGNIVGQGACGIVYEGHLADGSVVAIKRLDTRNIKKSSKAEEQFLKETSMPVHRNLLPLLGFCKSHMPKELLLVSPLMLNGNLASCLESSKLDWSMIKIIAYGTAVALAYLHNDCQIVHRDVKAENILLDENFEAVVADFGLVRHMDGKSHVTTFVCGTRGYIAPEYVNDARCSNKIDVYAYGILLLEIITGRRAKDIVPDTEHLSVKVPDWIVKVVNHEGVGSLVDPRLQGKYDYTEAKKLIDLALECTQISPGQRPTMSKVVQILKDLVPSIEEKDPGDTGRRRQNV